MQAYGWSENLDGGFYVSERNFLHLPPIEANTENLFLTVMSGFSPSPDWYTGLYHFRLTDKVSRTWYDHIKFQTYPWDLGTDAGVTYISDDFNLDPQIPVEKITTGNAPPGGELKSPDGLTVPVAAEWECYLVIGEEPMILPSCDWFANPCCNETDTVNCDAELPWTAAPEISDEYRQVLDNGGSLMAGDTTSVFHGNGGSSDVIPSDAAGGVNSDGTSSDAGGGLGAGISSDVSADTTGIDNTTQSNGDCIPGGNISNCALINIESSLEEGDMNEPPIADEGVNDSSTMEPTPSSIAFRVELLSSLVTTSWFVCMLPLCF
ncbi:Extracellular matrix protein [Seminavis robusta]|uniref:Extracellular matrix protein n=1 Tax=Seminavis robusta TaxID=568900 RepID=A0A9N8EIV7_9STRA|nr:Extracellular matrix protein [Seminavis robusta]|eukprot:Sro1026_g232900.1 Extracellular matrix protein (321) ;mRNA; f:20598-21560